MGCGNPKEKVEDKMMKMKMALIEVQMEKYKQLELLKKMDGKEIETPNIPNYIDKEFLNKYFSTKRNSSSTKDDFLTKSGEEFYDVVIDIDSINALKYKG